MNTQDSPQNPTQPSARQSDSSTVQITPLSLPKGGGAIQGIGETFQADEFTGTASFSVPVPTSPCRGFEPSLALTYSSGAGNSPFGLGWDLAIPSISRKTNKGQPHYNDDDTFVLSSAEDMVAVNGSDETVAVGELTYTLRRYRPRVEVGFARIEYWRAEDDANSFWRTITTDNVTHVFGYDQHSRIVNPHSPTQVFEWLLTLSYDAHGNAIYYHYQQENAVNVPDTLAEINRSHTARRYLQRVCYGNASPWVVHTFPADLAGLAAAQWHFEVALDYGEYANALDGNNPYTPTDTWLARADAFSRYDCGFELRTHRLCRNILVFHRFVELDTAAADLASARPRLTHRLTLNYDENPTLTRLSSINTTGYRYQVTDDDYQTLSLPPLDFGYTAFTAQGHAWSQLQQQDNQAFPDWDGAGYRLVDVYGEGIPGVLYLDGATASYWRKMASGESSAEAQSYSGPFPLGKQPLTHHTEGAGARLMDLTGNGQLDWVSTLGTTTGFFQGKATAAQDKYAEGSWREFEAFESTPREFFHPQADLLDATGDGLSDLVLLAEHEVKVYPSRGKQGFDEALMPFRDPDVPTSKADSAKELLRFVDILGTGRQHWVRVRNGSVECWPNLGYGRFGDRIQLDHAPHFGTEFDTRRLFLADIDGSGTADLIYAHSDHIAIYLNHSGNRFSTEPVTLALPGRWDNLDQISFADVRGNGTQCLVFAERKPQARQWFYDFCQGVKPYLLSRVSNNMGARTDIVYTSSTQFYLQDKEQGQPWLTALPFPVQVVRQVLAHDLIANNTLRRIYRYHHGYYDEVEREFRGFGRVERQDAEVFSDTGSPEHYVAPARNITWYHTGAPHQNTLTEQYRNEYYQGDAEAAALADSSIDYGAGTVDLTAADESTQREAQRALKGQILRTELYGLDGNEHPYHVVEQRYHIRQLQARGDLRYGVFFTHLIESLNYTCERNASDPCVNHELVLAVNDYGSVVQTAQLAYGRRDVADVLPEQQTMRVTSAIQRTINDVSADSSGNVHQIGLGKEALSYEITNLSTPTGSSEILTYEQVKTQLCAHDPETQLPFAAGIQSTLLSWQQQYYIAAGDDTPLDFGVVDAQALPSHSEQVVFGEDQINAAPQGLQDQMVNGGYRQHNGYWWNPGGKQRYYGVSSYCQAREVVDPFGNVSTYDRYDAHWLMPLQSTDALGNSTTAQQVDYQVLQARKVVDINGNSSEVRFDALGQVFVTSFYGTENGRAVGFEPLDSYTVEDAPDSNTVINNPTTYLQNAASYFYYDLFSWQQQGQPVRAVQLTAEDYPGLGGGIPIAITYSDGLSRTLQNKTLVESGEAFTVNGDGSVSTITADPRWLSSNRVVYNNKGEPVKQYEPYYSDTYDFIDNATLNTFGVTPTLHYDPLGRVVRVDTAKGFFSKVEFTPWSEQHYEENDTVTDSTYYQDNIDNAQLPEADITALEKAAVFHDTPAENILDNLGRTIRSRQRNKTAIDDPMETLTEHYTYDIVGNQLTSADARLSAGSDLNFVTTYNLANEALHNISADAGESWMLSNVVGNPLYRQDARGIEQTFTYDELHRPVSEHVTGNDGQQNLDHTVTLTLYGENQASAGDYNLRGQVYQHYDQAGLNQVNAYSLSGQPLNAQRQLRSDYETEADWPAAENDRIALLETETFTTSVSYDALARVQQSTDADNNITSPVYHISGRLDQLSVTHGDGGTTGYVQGISYNARHQRERISYGNGVTTDYYYEDTTFRLTRINSQRGDHSVLQDLNYTYDPVGNITQIEDLAWNAVFNNNQQVDPQNQYTYDALYRLLEATGREHESLAGKHQPGRFGQLSSMPAINDVAALVNYTLSYHYDQAGNLHHIHHSSSSADWTRELVVANNNNRAVEQNSDHPITPDQVNSYFDHNGNQIQLDGINRLQWNYRNHLAHVEKTSQLHEYHVYDSSGQRVRKIRVSTTTGYEDKRETIYLGGLEIYRTSRDSAVVKERHTLRVNDDSSQVANREYWVIGDPPAGVSATQVRYQLENHLGSASLEVDTAGLIISYEEYNPYGGTSFIAGNSAVQVSLKRYRYSGKERDELTGFYYYGARYYLPWLGRWLSADPAGTIDGLNLYQMAGNNPIKYVDPTGYSYKDYNEEQREAVEQIEFYHTQLSESNDILKKLEARLKSIADKDKGLKRNLKYSGVTLGKTFAKGAASTAAGAGAGAAVGTAGFPVVGTLVGAAVGGLVGLVVGKAVDYAADKAQVNSVQPKMTDAYHDFKHADTNIIVKGVKGVLTKRGLKATGAPAAAGLAASEAVNASIPLGDLIMLGESFFKGAEGITREKADKMKDFLFHMRNTLNTTRFGNQKPRGHTERKSSIDELFTQVVYGTREGPDDTRAIYKSGKIDRITDKQLTEGQIENLEQTITNRLNNVYGLLSQAAVYAQGEQPMPKKTYI